MTFRDLLNLVSNNLRRMKARVAMTATGVIIGTAAVVVLVSLGAGLQKLATQNLYGMGGLDELIIRDSSVWESSPDGGKANNHAKAVLDEKMLDEIRQMEGVIAVTPLMELRIGGPLKVDRQEGWGQVYGVDMNAFTKIIQLDQGTSEIYRGQVIIGAQVPENFIPWETRERSETPPPPPDLMGKTLQMVNYQYSEGDRAPTETVVGKLQVVGILQRKGYIYDYGIFMPLKEAQRLNQQLSNGELQQSSSRNNYLQVLVKVEDPNQATAIEQVMKEKGFSVQSDRDQLESINQFFLIVQAILGGIGAIALLVAAFGIANTMIMAIYERTQEIGLMKAIGATNQDVMSVFLAESGAIGFIGGIGGIALAMGLNTVINIVGKSLIGQGGDLMSGSQQAAEIALTHTPLWLLIFAIIFATMIGVASGIYPAIRAAALSPIQALKYE